MRGCIAFFLFIFVVAPLLFVFETAAAASTWMFKTEVYSDVLSTPEIYSSLLDIVLYQTGDTVERLRQTGEFDEIMASVDNEEWRAAVNAAVQQLFDIVEGRTDTINLRIPLSPLKAVLESSNGASFIRSYVSNLPRCSGNQEPTTLNDPRISGVLLPLCFPAGTTQDAYAAQLVERLPALVAAMPDNFTFTDEVDNTFISDLRAVGLGSLRGGLVAVAGFFGVFAVGVWFVTGLIAAARARGRLMWLGIMLAIPSLSVLMIAIGISSLLSIMVVNMSDGTMVSGAVSRATYDAAASGIQTIMPSFMAAGGIPMVIGVLLFFLGVILPSSRRDEIAHDLANNPTAYYSGKAKNDFGGYEKPKNDFDVFNKPKNDDIINPL